MKMNSKTVKNVGKLVLGLGVAAVGIMLITKKSQKADEEERELEMKEVVPEVAAIGTGVIVAAVGQRGVAKAYDVEVEDLNPIIVTIDVVEYYGRKIGLKKIGVGLGALGVAGIVYGTVGTIKHVNNIKVSIAKEKQYKNETDRLRHENEILQNKLNSLKGGK